MTRPGHRGCYTIGELADAKRTALRYACTSCGRKGALPITELIESFGRDAGLPSIRMPIARRLGCERHDESGYNVCRIGYVPRSRAK